MLDREFPPGRARLSRLSCLPVYTWALHLSSGEIESYNVSVIMGREREKVRLAASYSSQPRSGAAPPPPRSIHVDTVHIEIKLRATKCCIFVAGHMR